jgi:sugar phosphate isomerase/epimerase
MVPALLAESGVVSHHHPLGASTGYMEVSRGDWPAMVADALATSSFAAELAALSEDELPALEAYVAGAPELPFAYLSIHAPVKHLRMPEAELVRRLTRLAPFADAIVVHPDAMEDPRAYRPLGSCLVLENMDARKPTGRTAEELAPFFATLPEAGLCLDVAHVLSVDASMAEGERLLDAFAGRLRHLHVSSVDESCRHVPLTAEHEGRFGSLLRRCPDVPWILEAPLP